MFYEFFSGWHSGFIRYTACCRYNLFNILCMWVDFKIFIYGLGCLLSTKCLQIHIHQVPIFLYSRHYHLSQIVCPNQNVEDIVPQIVCSEFYPSSPEPLPPVLIKLIFSYFPSFSFEQYILLLIDFCYFLNHFGIKDFLKFRGMHHQI